MRFPAEQHYLDLVEVGGRADPFLTDQEDRLGNIRIILMQMFRRLAIAATVRCRRIVSLQRQAPSAYVVRDFVWAGPRNDASMRGGRGDRRKDPRDERGERRKRDAREHETQVRVSRFGFPVGCGR